MTEIKPLKEVQREHALKVLRSTGGDLDRAARILGISVEDLRRRMKEFDLRPGEAAPGSGT